MNNSRLLGALALLLISTDANAADWERVGGQGQMQFVLVVKAKEKETVVYHDAIQALCKPGAWCGLSFWSSRGSVPAKLPMTAAQENAQVASYTYNPRTGYRELLWNCRINPNPNECFK